MRILNSDTEKALTNITLYLTMTEAKEMYDGLESLINSSIKNDHVHVNDIEFEHELTVVVYDESNLAGLDKISVKVIQDETSCK